MIFTNKKKIHPQLPSWWQKINPRHTFSYSSMWCVFCLALEYSWLDSGTQNWLFSVRCLQNTVSTVPTVTIQMDFLAVFFLPSLYFFSFLPFLPFPPFSWLRSLLRSRNEDHSELRMIKDIPHRIARQRLQRVQCVFFTFLTCTRNLRESKSVIETKCSEDSKWSSAVVEPESVKFKELNERIQMRTFRR